MKVKAVEAVLTTEDLQMIYDALDILNPDSEDGHNQKAYLLQYVSELQNKIKS